MKHVSTTTRITATHHHKVCSDEPFDPAEHLCEDLLRLKHQRTPQKTLWQRSAHFARKEAHHPRPF